MPVPQTVDKVVIFRMTGGGHFHYVILLVAESRASFLGWVPLQREGSFKRPGFRFINVKKCRKIKYSHMFYGIIILSIKGGDPYDDSEPG